MKRFLLLALLLLAPISAYAGGPVPAVNSDMGCSASGQPLYYNGSALSCGSAVLSIAGETISGGGAPSIAAGTGAGTSPTIAVTGGLNSQIISITTGTCTVTCPGSAVIATVTLPISCATTVAATMTPMNINVAQLSASGSVYLTSAAVNTYVLNSSSTGLVPSTLYKWVVHVDCW